MTYGGATNPCAQYTYSFILYNYKKRFVTLKICIFCSANQQLDPDFFGMTEELGRWLAKEGHTLVYGGVNSGLMECVARAVKQAGGRTVGVIPKIVEKGGRISDYVDVEIMCDNLSDRKQLMEDRSDVFIALPGGIGTIDEVFTVAAAHTIGFHDKRVILYNMKGFWNDMAAMLDNLQQRGMVRGQWRDYIAVAESLEDIKDLLSQE